MSYRDFIQEHRRLVILRDLNEVPGYALNSSILADLLERAGLKASRDQIHADLAWLAEQGLVETGTVGSVQTAKLTQRGADVATGQALVPGVKRPGPGG